MKTLSWRKTVKFLIYETDHFLRRYLKSFGIGLFCIILGVLSARGLPPWHNIVFFSLGFIGLIRLIDLAPSFFSSALRGGLFGFGYFFISFYWIGNAFLVDASRYGWMAPFAVIGISIFLSIFSGASTSLTWLVSRKIDSSIAGKVVIFAILWTMIEWFRSVAFTGLPWNLIATVWAESEEFIQISAFVGVYGLGLFTLILLLLPVTFIKSGITLRSSGWLLVTILGVSSIWSAGKSRLTHSNTSFLEDMPLRLIQANIPQHLKWHPKYKLDHIQTHVNLSTMPSKDKIKRKYVIWPETAVPFNLSSEKNLRKYLAKAIPTGGMLITGALRTNFSNDSAPSYFNSLYAITETGSIKAIYDKVHLVPFGEYVPYKNILGISKLTEGRVDFSSGENKQVWRWPGFPSLVPLICYEAIFSDIARAVTPRPSWILNVTNDAWFGLSAGPHQHFAAVRFRAVELGLPLVRVANTGISAVIDPYGRILKRLELGKSGVIDSLLPHQTSEPTLYSKFGNIITGLLLVGFAIFSFFLRSK